MKFKYILLVLVLSLLPLSGMMAQDAQTLYFMEEIPERNNMNPAFTPNCKFYFDFVFLPNFYLGAGTNQFILNDFLFKNGNSTANLLSSPEFTNRFLKRLKPTTTVNVNASISILSFGFRFNKRNFITFDWEVNADVAAYLPKDVFRLALLGTPEEYGVNSFDFSKIGVDVYAYSNIGVGYMRQISDKWTFGLKAKYLMGYGAIQTNINKMNLDASRENWTLRTDGKINASLPVDYSLTPEGEIDFNTIQLWSPANELVRLLYKPAGHGAALDLGFTYKPIKSLTLSAAVTDLGFIYWKNNCLSGTMRGEHVIDEFINYQPGDTLDANMVLDRLENMGNEILETMTTDGDGTDNSFISMLNANFTVGVEYGVLNNKISFGVVNRLKFNNSHLRDEATLAVNFRPLHWLKAAVSYSFVNGRGANLGLGLNLRTGMFNMFLVTDYIPLSWASVATQDARNMSLPYRTQMVNVHAGLTWNLGRFSNDPDNDGVFRRRDHCPDTDMDFLRIQCPGLKKKQLVDKFGCERDEDKDGINDCYDRCPATPAGVVVDSVGCPVDTDHDGVADYMDRCPQTPESVDVDENGCPFDADRDGVYDYLDSCPATPLGVVVDSVGCPIDTDRDGVVDYMDRCPQTPEGVEVDESGCPIDTDRDGVPDYMDNCPETTFGVRVDIKGCPVDSDGDGVTDDVDRCPYQKGEVDNQGCPELTREVKNLFKKAMNGIQFETGKAVIKKSSYPILDKIVGVLEFNPEYKLNISGHTDNTGSAERNLQLSKDRAASVAKYMIDKGISPDRLRSEGYGQTKPIADNKTQKGRALNRRVEFEVEYIKVTTEKIVNPELIENNQ